MDISPTRDLFGTPIVKIWGSKSFLSNFSSKILFEKKSRFTAKRHILKKTFITKAPPPIIANLPARALRNTYCEYIGLKRLYKLFFFKNAYRDKKKSFYGETTHFSENFHNDDPPP